MEKENQMEALIQSCRELTADLEELRVLREQRQELIRYLNSPKFHNDTTVQVVDVLTRLGAR